MQQAINFLSALHEIPGNDRTQAILGVSGRCCRSQQVKEAPTILVVHLDRDPFKDRIVRKFEFSDQLTLNASFLNFSVTEVNNSQTERPLNLRRIDISE
jgi:hypothetical protein